MCLASPLRLRGSNKPNKRSRRCLSRQISRNRVESGRSVCELPQGSRFNEENRTSPFEFEQPSDRDNEQHVCCAWTGRFKRCTWLLWWCKQAPEASTHSHPLQRATPLFIVERLCSEYAQCSLHQAPKLSSSPHPPISHDRATECWSLATTLTLPARIFNLCKRQRCHTHPSARNKAVNAVSSALGSGDACFQRLPLCVRRSH